MRNNLRRCRENKKMTQREVANILGISRSAYTNIERGIRNPSFTLSLRLKEVMGYKGDDIFENVGEGVIIHEPCGVC